MQVRIEGEAAIHGQGALATSALGQAMSRVCYGSERTPGRVFNHGGGFTLPQEDDAKRIGRENFRAVLVRVDRLDFLYLDRRGHLRAGWWRDSGD